MTMMILVMVVVAKNDDGDEDVDGKEHEGDYEHDF